ncbi:Imm26 family immunity protein [Pendulispora albinea]|uniref:Immunity 26/phosphotriesterase HocA family protein n=1 Tax=Pendulispora albinea TaxID=2741071 RepID=A0ABZ2M8A0_9BACT
MARRKIIPRLGDVFEIPLADGKLAFGHILRGNLVGFYGFESDRRVSLDTVVASVVAFRIVCMIDSIEEGQWPILGNVPPPAPMNEPMRFWRSTAAGFLFIQEWRSDTGKEERRATEAEIAGLEESVIWNPSAVIARLKCFFRGEACPQVRLG